MFAVFDKVTTLAEGALREYLEREEGPVERALDCVVANPALSLPLFLSKIFSGTRVTPRCGLRVRTAQHKAVFSHFAFRPPCPCAARASRRHEARRRAQMYGSRTQGVARWDWLQRG